MKKLEKLIESAVKAMTPLKEYTDKNFSGAKVISDAMQNKPDSEDMEFITKYFPNAVKSMSTAQANLKASDASPIKKRMGQYAPMFVHVQYHTFTETSGQTFAVHQTQYYNSNFKDQDPKFNPRVTELNFYSGEDQDDKMGMILATTDEYIKDLRDLERLGMLGKRVSESLNEGSYTTTYMGANVLPPTYGNSKLNIVAEEVYGKKFSELTDELQEKILDLFRDPSINEHKMNTKTESIVKRLKEDSEYQKFFKSAMDKFGVKSPKSLSDKKKKEFFNYVDKNYKAKGE
jgi:hypothetical protein